MLVNRTKYDRALEMVRSGKWRVDPERGIIYGSRKMPVGSVNTLGYIYVTVWLDGRTINAASHRIIWEAVNGPVPDGLQINHINGVKTDNRIENLEVVTASENVRHSVRTGLFGKRKVDVAAVREIRARVRAGESNRSIAADYGLTHKTVGDIARATRWGKTMEPDDDVSKITRVRLLTQQEKKEIAEKRSAGVPRKDLAAEYGVDNVTVWRVCRDSRMA